MEVAGRGFRRNRRQLCATLEPPPEPTSSIEEVNPSRAQDGGRSPDLPGEDPDPPAPVIQEDVTPSPPASVPDSVGTDFGDPPRRSKRSRRPPVWLKD